MVVLAPPWISFKVRHWWARNQSGIYKKEKERLCFIIDTRDRKAESGRLSNAELDSLRRANEELAILRRDEESKWAQRAKVKHIQEGSDNTKYFHLLANGKHRRKKKFSLSKKRGRYVVKRTSKIKKIR
jgi:hypothetical protein